MLKTTTSQSITEELKSIFSQHGIPETIISDNTDLTNLLTLPPYIGFITSPPVHVTCKGMDKWNMLFKLLKAA